MTAVAPPIGRAGFDLYANEGSRVIGSQATLLVLSTTFVALRLLSRKLSGAGFWVSLLAFKEENLEHC